jgi:hypothetical protein
MDPHEGASSDPLSLHKYLYAHDDPVGYADPSGLSRRISQNTGYVATGDGQHMIPFSTWDQIDFDYDAMEFLDSEGARLPAPNHDATKHPRYTHEVRAEWERFLDSPAGKKYRTATPYGDDVAKAFLKHVKSAGNKYIDGFNSAVGGGPAAVERWFRKEGKHIPISVLKTTIWKKAAKRLGKKIPYLNYLVAGATYTGALESARAAHDSEAVAQLEALAEAINPLPFSQEDIRQIEASGKRFWHRRQMNYENQRFGDLLQ